MRSELNRDFRASIYALLLSFFLLPSWKTRLLLKKLIEKCISLKIDSETCMFHETWIRLILVQKVLKIVTERQNCALL